MTYTFGYEGTTETLKTKDIQHTNLSGSCNFRSEYPDSNISDTCFVVKKIRTAEDSEGNCYDWYEIKGHYRNIDYFTPVKDEVIPYTETKTAYIGDTEVTFMTDKPGNLTVFFPYNYTVERMTDRITVSFDELEEVTDITISIL